MKSVIVKLDVNLAVYRFEVILLGFLLVSHQGNWAY